MRQVFSSPRLENVEAVAQMLEAEGIEVRISNGRSYRGGIRGNFSYVDDAASRARPAVWIIRSEDQPRARQMLREAGLLKTSAAADDNFLLPAVQPRASDADDPWRKGARFRYGLLVLIAVLVALVFVSSRRTLGDADAVADAPPPAARAPALAPAEVTVAPTVFEIPTPPALAATLFATELADLDAAGACLSVDGADAPPAVLEALAGMPAGGRPASACTDAGAVRLEVRGYRTDGSGVGTVELQVGEASRRLEVERIGRDWRVLGPG
jgi:hypothetical protein